MLEGRGLWTGEHPGALILRLLEPTATDRVPEKSFGFQLIDESA